METGIEIQASPAATWLFLIDTWRWPQWGPSVFKVESASRYISQGTVGRVQTLAGIWLPFEITKFSPGYRWDWKVAGIPATGHRVEPIGLERCRVVFEVPAVAFPYLLICRSALARIRTMLEGSS